MRPTSSVPAVILALTSFAAAPVTTAGDAGGVAVERWVVGFDPAAGLPDDLPAVLERAGAVSAAAFTTVDTLAVTLPATGVDQLISRPDVIGARPERRLAFHLETSVPFIGADRATLDAGGDVTVTPPDGEPSVVARPSVDGTGQVVAIVDTGVWADHPDLAGRVVASLDFELAYAAELLLTPEQLDTFAATTGPLAGPTDDVGHGTHVAGIVSGTGAGARGRVNDNRGVAPGAQLVDLRISPQAHTTDNNVGWERNALAAYDWLLRHHDEFGPHGIRVANNSWGVGDSTVTGEPLDYSPFTAILDAAEEAGITVVFSAGNRGPSDDVTAALLPTGAPTVLTVAAGCKPGTSSRGCSASEPDEAIASFSSHGDAVDVTAPGVDIVAAVNPSSGKVLGQLSGDFSGADPADAVVHRALYASFSGTSMSAPHVAGAVALLLQADPTLTPAEVRFIVTATARDILDAGRDRASGWGTVDVPAALDAVVRKRAGIPLTVQFPGFAPGTGGSAEG